MTETKARSVSLSHAIWPLDTQFLHTHAKGGRPVTFASFACRFLQSTLQPQVSSCPVNVAHGTLSPPSVISGSRDFPRQP